ncbi:Quinone oxidoreductase [Acidisarcina polymorpha]|uniref:Quinone oxidoreductase n=1 Tax=Acidisarcina polymorpha TaxID=2211140 RepID=A0A2Z5FZG3_9BACT|nr:quinone oxidoreductase [Acidisarcina polymorpha]AXC12159.1 Quinone oxidoreductase [Acidisarcina polymorpha]
MRLVDLPVPAPASGQVLVKVTAAGVNFVDTYYREGRYKAGLPLVLGQEFAGTVERTGPGVEGLSLGDRVASASGIGAYAEYALAPAATVVPVPDGLPLETAAAALLQGMTAHYLVFSTCTLGPGKTALVHAAAGGTGQLLVQMAKLTGAAVIATVSTEEKARVARDAGADHVILYEQEDFEVATRTLTKGKGVDVVYDSVGRTTFDRSLRCLRPRGLMVLFGASSGAVPPLDLLQLSAHGSLYVTRPTLKDYVASRKELEQRAGEVFDWIVDGRLRVVSPRVYPLSEAAQAQADLAARVTSGKLLLFP